MSEFKIDSGHTWFAKEDFNKAIADLEASRARVKELEKKLTACEDPIRRYVLLSEALTPSPDTKFAFNGEFHFSIELAKDDGDTYSHKVTVPWTTVKDIMKAIKSYANVNM